MKTSELLIDVSQHNGNIDFEKAKYSGLNNVIIRVGWIGNKQNHTIDTKFEENYKKAKDAGLKIGFYIYSYCKSVETLRQGIEWLLDKVDGKRCDIGIFLDLEDKTIEHIGKEELTKQATQFCRIIKNAGYLSGVYASKYWFNNLLNIKELLNYKIWLAEWNDKENYSVNYRVDIWQYSSKGNIKGINGNVDINRLYYKNVDIEQLAQDVIKGKYGNGEDRKKALGNLYTEVQKRVNEILNKNNIKEEIYIVKKGDCLCNIAKKFKTTVNKIASDNGITNIDLIYVGQKLIIRR